MSSYDFVCPKCGAKPMESCRSVTKIGAPYLARHHAERPTCNADLAPAIAVWRRPLKLANEPGQPRRNRRRKP